MIRRNSLLTRPILWNFTEGLQLANEILAKNNLIITFYSESEKQNKWAQKAVHDLNKLLLLETERFMTAIQDATNKSDNCRNSHQKIGNIIR